MSKAAADSVDAYLARQPPEVRAILERVRATIRKAVPAAEECIDHRIPTFRLHGKNLVHFAGWANHWALYPGSGKTVGRVCGRLGKL